jgi:hypothetical protein
MISLITMISQRPFSTRAVLTKGIATEATACIISISTHNQSYRPLSQNSAAVRFRNCTIEIIIVVQHNKNGLGILKQYSSRHTEVWAMRQDQIAPHALVGTSMLRSAVAAAGTCICRSILQSEV